LRHWSTPKKIFDTGSENPWNIDKRVVDLLLGERRNVYSALCGLNALGQTNRSPPHQRMRFYESSDGT